MCVMQLLGFNPTAAALHSSNVAWTADHHDPQNSGSSPLAYNTTGYTGACMAKAATPTQGNKFAATGVTTTDGKYLIIGE